MIIYQKSLAQINLKNINFILAPTSIYLPLFKNSNITLCIQDISLNENKSLTGDILISQIKSLDVSYALIGHYERKYYYKESEIEILKKIKLCLSNDIKVIYCIGESKEERNRRVEYQVLERQIAKIFNKLDNKELKKIIIAYEPADLIGTDTIYDILKIRSMISFIKKLVKDYYGIDIIVVFGGNVNLANIQSLTALREIDGYIICSSILNPENIPKIITKMTNS